MIQIYKPTNTNYNQNGDSVLTPSLAKVTAELNGAWSATIEHPIDEDGRWEYIVDEAVVKMPSFNGEQLFRIKQKEKSDSGISASLEPIFWDCIGDCILINKRPAYANGQKALDVMTAANPKYSGRSNIAETSYADYHLINLMEAISGEREDSFLNHWGGEIIYDNFTVIINERAGRDNGVELRYGKNIPIDGMREETDFEGIITRIYPLAFGGMHSLTDNNGNVYYGYVDSPIADKYPAAKAAVMTFDDVKMREDLQENEDTKGLIVCDTQAELDAALRAKCEAQFAAGIDKPKVTISADMVLLQNTVEYKDYQVLEEVSLGDTIHCINTHLGIVTDARIISLTYDSVTKKVDKVVIGDYQYDYFNALTSGTWKANTAAVSAASDAALANQSTADIKKELEARFPVSIADGGTGKTTADEARENLGAAPKKHTHDDRYYTETEVDDKLGEKADKTHTHDDRYYTETEVDGKLAGKADTTHAHGDIYYTKTEVDNGLKGKADKTHNHDDRYYTETEVDDKLGEKADKTHTHDDRYYTETEVDGKLAGKADTTHAHGDIYYTKTEVDNGLKGKADKTHNHDDRYYTETEIDSKLTEKAAKNHAHGEATEAEAGFMSAEDKKKLDGIAEGANNYVLPAASGTVRGGVKLGYAENGKNYPVEAADEKLFVNVPWKNTTYAVMTGATASAAGKKGLVPAPTAGKQGMFLRGDGTWQTVNAVQSGGVTGQDGNHQMALSWNGLNVIAGIDNNAAVKTLLDTSMATDYIVERGTASSWHYTKYKSGRVEAWRRTTSSNLGTAGTHGGFYYRIYTVALPAGLFTSIEDAHVDCYWGTGISWGSARNVTTSNFEAVYFSNQNGGAGTFWHYVRGMGSVIA